ncbi:MAG: hypothetical protein ACR2JB_11970 [Bryobacteraceae bacterium]
MEQNKLKIKVGDFEFEAEGPSEVVQAQLAAFKELLASAQTQPKEAENPEQGQSNSTPPQKPTNNGPLALDQIIKVEGRVVSLTAHTNSLEDALMLLLLGQKTFRSNDGVTGGELVDGLKRSGQSTDHMGRTLDKIAAEGNVIITGAHRGKRYRMTNAGVNKAQQIARGVIDLVA